MKSDDYKRGFRDGIAHEKLKEVQAIRDLYFPHPGPVESKSIKCSKCGMIWEGAMLYCCPHSDCPVQLKPTC